MPNKSEIELILDKYGKELVAGVKENMTKPQTRINSQGQTYSANPIASGNLFKSIKFNVKYFGKYWEFNLISEDYFGALDKGRGGAKDSNPKFYQSNIYNWVKRKGLTMQGQLSKKKLSKIPNLDKQQQSLSFLIKRKINRKGFKGYGFYTNFMKQSNWVNRFEKDLSVAFGKEITLDLKDFK